MSIYDSIDAIRTAVREHRWADVEQQGYEECRSLDSAAADAIRGTELTEYEAALADGLRGAFALVGPAVQAMYWEFDLDNQWQSAFFPCHRYAPEASGDDDWASDFDAGMVLAGPDQPGLAAHYASLWDATTAIAARNAYLIARTLAAFGRAAGSSWIGQVPLCAGYHDLDVVFRVSARE